MVVVPPRTAARVPVSKSSAVTVPATCRSKWVWASIKPGNSRQPVTSRISVSPSARRPISSPVPTAAIFSPSMSTSAGTLPLPDTTVPPFNNLRFISVHSFPKNHGSSRLPRPSSKRPPAHPVQSFARRLRRTSITNNKPKNQKISLWFPVSDPGPGVHTPPCLTLIIMFHQIKPVSSRRAFPQAGARSGTVRSTCSRPLRWPEPWGSK